MKFNYCKIHQLAQDEDKMVAFLQDMKLLEKERTCSCGKVMVLRKLEGGYYWRCWSTRIVNFRKVKCDVKVSLKKGSWFSNSKLDFGTVLKMTYGLVKNYDQQDVQNEAEVNKNTVNNWAAYMRQVLLEWSLSKSEMIGGEGVIVEIDESKFGKRKYNKGHRVEGQWIFGGVERGTGNAFLVPVEKRDTQTLLTIIKQWIRPGTTILSDCWKAYDCLKEKGFQHLTVNHKLHFVDPETGVHTNTVEGLWRHAKAFLPTYCRLKKNYASYLAHYSFFKKARSQKKDIFEYFLEEVSQIKFDLELDAETDENGIPLVEDTDGEEVEMS